jgi:hypothetical protein
LAHLRSNHWQPARLRIRIVLAGFLLLAKVTADQLLFSLLAIGIVLEISEALHQISEWLPAD